MASLAEMQAELARRGAVSQDDLLEEEFIARGLDPALLDEPQAPDGTALDLTTPTLQQPVEQPPQEQPQTVLNPVVAEGASAINRGIAGIPDFVIDAANTLMENIPAARVVLEPILNGEPIPGVQDTLQEATGGAFGERNFMDPGLARDVVQQAGELAPSVVSLGGTAKTAAKVTQNLADDAATEAARTAGRLRVGDKRAVTQQISAAGQAIDDPAAALAIDRGFLDVEVAGVKAASGATKAGMRKMVDIAEDIVFRGQGGTRPLKVVGEAIEKRIVRIANVNRQAGKAIDTAAKKLANKTVDVSSVRTTLSDDLLDVGASLGDEGVELAESQILPTAKALMDDVVKRLDSANGDALKLHRLKRFIDKKVSFGKKSEGGLDVDAERILKTVRHNIDEVLDTNFKSYRTANERFAETRQALDKFLDVAGKSFDMDAPRVGERIGTLTRRIFSNAQSRETVMNAIEGLDDVAAKYGVDTSDNLVQMARFNEELKRVFKPLTQADTTFRSEIAKAGVDAATEGTTRSIINTGGRVARRVLGKDPDEEAKLQAIRGLLK